MRRFLGVFVLTFFVAQASCNGGDDKAKAAFERCLKLEAEHDLRGATAACENAVALDPTSESGRAARTRLDSPKFQRSGGGAIDRQGTTPVGKGGEGPQ
jgi:hypothetical protein